MPRTQEGRAAGQADRQTDGGRHAMVGKGPQDGSLGHSL